jgi:phage terminase large subunit-like protein
MLPYRNRSDGEPSWQYDIIWQAPYQKGIVACGGNRIGKSQIGGFVTALMVTGEHPTYKSPKNGRAWVVGLDSKAIEAIQKPYFEKFIPKRYIENGKWNGKYNYWTFDSDGRHWEVWFKSVDSGKKKFQSDAIDFCWVDEEPLKEGIFSEMEIRLIDKQGIWLMTATPVEGTRWLKDTLERDDVFYTMAGMRENPYIPLVEIEKVAAKLPKDERDVRIEGKYIIFGGRPVFDRDIIGELEKKAIPFREGLLAVA